MRTYAVNPKYQSLADEILAIPERFAREGRVLTQGRNVIKVMEVGGMRLNVKSYKRPLLINRFVYAYLRPTKAERSYRYATRLLQCGIGTPEPVAYIVYRNWWGGTESYYISLQVDCDCEFRALKVDRPADLRQILVAFTRFTYRLHENGMYFIDHSPGNTLIKRVGNGYDFYLVDLNRMKFKSVSPECGLRNFYRLDADDDMIDVIAAEYARLRGGDAKAMAESLKRWTHDHNARVAARRAKKAKRKK